MSVMAGPITICKTSPGTLRSCRPHTWPAKCQQKPSLKFISFSALRTLVLLHYLLLKLTACKLFGAHFLICRSFMVNVSSLLWLMCTPGCVTTDTSAQLTILHPYDTTTIAETNASSHSLCMGPDIQIVTNLRLHILITISYSVEIIPRTGGRGLKF